MKFSEITQFVPAAPYMVHVGLDYLAETVVRYVVEYNFDMSPDFQRGYVWTMEQKTRFVEYMLQGGRSGLDIYTNCPFWNSSSNPKEEDDWFVLVDGKQRLNATLGFLSNEVPVFGGNYHRDFTDRLRLTQCNFRWHVNSLRTRKECLQWYLDLNTGGTVHTEDELNKVRSLLTKGDSFVRPSPEEIQVQLECAIFREAFLSFRQREEDIRQSAANFAERERTKKSSSKKR